MTVINICIVAEYCQGMSLEKEIHRRAEQGQPWTDDQLKAFLIEMAEVMAKCQKLGINHWDLKPANVFLTSEGDFKVGDFG